MQQIADEAGVSRMSVSLAMRNSPKISATTAARIRAVAERIGYRPNPLVSALMTQLRHSKEVRKPSTIAYVTAYPTADGWRQTGPFVDFFEGARARAGALGYQLEEWWVRKPGLSEKRFSEILYTRNIHGVLVAPLPVSGGELNLTWEKFAAASIGYSLTNPMIHRASNDQYETITKALAELTRLGYRRIGLAIPADSDARVQHHWSAGVLVYQQSIPFTDRIPSLLATAQFSKEFIGWFEQYRPEVVLGLSQQCVRVMAEMGVSVPRDAGFVHLALSSEDKEVAGMNQNSELVGAAALDLIDAQLRRNERGVPMFAKSQLIPAYWVPGPSVRNIATNTGVALGLSHRDEQN